MLTLDDLITHAEGIGLTVAWANLGARHGQLNSDGTITLNPARTGLTQRVTLAHECGHWAYGHDRTFSHDRDRDEVQADAYAARLLIDPAELAAAEALFGSHVGGLARELGVTARLVELWRDR